MAPELPILQFEKVSEWTAWLEKEGPLSPGLWMRIAKKGSSHSSISYEQAVEGALCYGWIDGQGKKLDDDFYLQKFTPRRKRSLWSRINRERAERLIAEGRMQPSGLEEVERAKADGRWDAAYEPPSKIEVPADLQAALDASPAAKAFFESLSGTNRYAVLFRVHNAKRPETRARRIEEFVKMLAEGRKIYP